MNKTIHISSFPKITFLASIIVFCFVFGFYTGTKSEQDNQFKNKVVEISQPKGEGKLTEWKEYKNDDLGISFNYPETCGDLVVKYEYPEPTVLMIGGYFVDGINEIFQDGSKESKCSFASFSSVSPKFALSKKNFKNTEGFDALIVQNTMSKYQNDKNSVSKKCNGFCSDLLGYTEVTFNLVSSKLSAVKFSGKANEQFLNIINSVKIY